MKIFITGVAGFLGRHLAENFIKQSHSVSGCDDLSGGDLENIPDKTDFYNLDCKDFNKIRDIIDKEFL